MAKIHDEDGPMIGRMHDRYSDAVAHRAVPSSVSVSTGDIARGMGATPVNPHQAASAVGRGQNPWMIGESMLTTIGNLQESADAKKIKTSDDRKVKDQRGTKRS